MQTDPANSANRAEAANETLEVAIRTLPEPARRALDEATWTPTSDGKIEFLTRIRLDEAPVIVPAIQKIFDLVAALSPEDR